MQEGNNGSDFLTVILSKPLKKNSGKYWEDLNQTVKNLTVRFLKRFAVFLLATDRLLVFVSVLGLLIRRSSSEKDCLLLVRNFYQSYAAFLDERAYLAHGSMTRDYHRQEDAEFVRSDFPFVSACSIDGIKGLLGQIANLNPNFAFAKSATARDFEDVSIAQMTAVVKLFDDLRDSLDRSIQELGYSFIFVIEDAGEIKGSKQCFLVVDGKKEEVRMDSGFSSRDVLLHNILGTKDSVESACDSKYLIPATVWDHLDICLSNQDLETRNICSLREYFPEIETQLNDELEDPFNLGPEFRTSSGQPERSDTQLNVELSGNVRDVDLGSEFGNSPAGASSQKAENMQEQVTQANQQVNSKKGSWWRTAKTSAQSRAQVSGRMRTTSAKRPF